MAATVDGSDTAFGESDLMHEDYFFNSRGCFCFPCIGPRRPANLGPGLWERLRAAENEERWWARGFTAVMKAREWSEIVAGPKWKTFIRRFNRTGSRIGKQGKFQYDPLSYALNFDEGQNGDLVEEADFGRFRNFSARFASVPPKAVATEESGKDVTLL